MISWTKFNTHKRTGWASDLCQISGPYGQYLLQEKGPIGVGLHQHQLLMLP